jgi:MSHA biogenesis protein MshI
LAVVHRNGGERPVLERCEVLPVPGGTGAEAVSERLRAAGLPSAPVSSVLAAGQYQLVMVEAPDVPPAELRAAMRWRLRELIEFPVDDAVIDVFDLPTSGRGAQHRTVYAVAARRSVVDQQTAACAWSRHFDVIDVPELALRNLAMLLPQSAAGVALLHVEETTAMVVLVRGGTFYLARQMSLQVPLQLGAAESGESAIDGASVALELQRSLDYYERHFDQPPITQIAVAPAGTRTQALVDALATETGLAVAEFDLNRVMQCASPVDRTAQRSCLLAVGAALRVERRTL